MEDTNMQIGNNNMGIKLKPPKWLTADILRDWIL
jgi:hypothetical protein